MARRKTSAAKAAPHITEADVHAEVIDLFPLDAVAKSIGTVDPETQKSNLTDTEAAERAAWGQAGCLEPTLSPRRLNLWYQISSSLQQLVDVMMTNVFGGGWRLEPALDLGSEDTWNSVRADLILRREEAELTESSEAGRDPKPIEDPTDDEVSERIESLKEDQWRQRQRALRFLRNVNPRPEGDLVDILWSGGEDREVIGWCCFEIRRNAKGEPSRVSRDMSWTFRGLPLDEPISTKVRIQESDVSWDYEDDWVRFRRFVQISPATGTSRYFKEYGDPRVISALSGKTYKDEKALKKAEPTAAPATELLWIPMGNPESAIYGLNRWAGNVASVVGCYKMEVVNLLYFENKAIPPLVIMVKGGRLAAQAKTDITNAIRDHIKGSGNFHGVLIIEAAPVSSGPNLTGQAQQGQVEIAFEPLTKAFFTDQLFGEYDKANRDKVRQAFRIPRLLTGDTEKDNRATAEATLRFFDAQVAGPERSFWERIINRTLLRDLGITLWRWKLNAPVQLNPLEFAKIIDDLVQDTITVKEARRLVSRIFGEDLDRIEGAAWMEVPAKVFLSGLAGSSGTDESVSLPAGAFAKLLMGLDRRRKD